ncbi:hypothetical protein [Cellulomonas sp. C5510]|uniref:hypothetical protein n=1 Tax=Cellulomonas sp. C5510 TaxID=2871170 RepID=UPI001C95B4F2|nr:hypothetical protein [Cellulomonas sp. C5510]QZN86617.1 hypothetical protein K5O09_05580 [Cellulomonas sp. C5510]
MSDKPTDRPEGLLPDGDPDDVAEASTPGSDGDGPESGYQSEPEQTGEDQPDGA